MKPQQSIRHLLLGILFVLAMELNLTYDVSYKFTGKIDKVTIDLKPMEGATARQNEKLQHQATAAKALQD